MPPPNTDQDETIDKLWADAAEQIVAINPATENWKAQVLPLARIKKIMKSEDAISGDFEQDQAPGMSTTGQRFMIAGEAPVLLEKACELLVRELTARAWRHTERCRRRTLQRQDVHAAVSENEVYDFLIDIVPRVAALGSGNKSYVQGPSSDQAAMGGAPMSFGADGVVVAAATGKESGMSLADAELRLAQLQQMQEQFIMMQQRMRAEAVGGAPNPAGQQHPPQMQQMMMHPALFLQAQQQQQQVNPQIAATTQPVVPAQQSATNNTGNQGNTRANA